MALAELRSNAVERRNFLAPKEKFDDQKFEFIFVLDRSSSMRRRKIDLAKNALQLFLRSLPVTCKFNIYSFGNIYEKFQPASIDYTEQNLTKATKYVQGLGADFVGTNLTGPLRDIYSSGQFPGYLTQIFILTDGVTQDRAGDVRLVEYNRTFARIFTLEVGTPRSIDPWFLNRISGIGGGLAEFVEEPEEIRTKVLNQLKIALRPSMLKAIPV